MAFCYTIKTSRKFLLISTWKLGDGGVNFSEDDTEGDNDDK